ncbi:MAG TPA: YceI family protein [Byssovorax sp.]|jgi:polyisoprenoid-binding protein YceI
MTTTHWDFDNTHSNVDFTVRHMVVSKVRGRFAKWSGSLELDTDDLATAKVEAHIDASSVDTSDAQRDGHLRTADFFDVEHHPELVFKSTGVVVKSKERAVLKGDLTIRGVTKPVELDVEFGGRMKDPWGKQRVGFTATGSVDRKDFGVSFNQTLDHGGVALGDKVAITIDVEATERAS